MPEGPVKRFAEIGLAARHAAFAFVLAAAALCAPGAQAQDRAGIFDFYVLALSWSPSFCATDTGGSPQCRGGAGFVVHGLWPQYERGFPETCDSTFPQRIDRSIAESMADIMPDQRLVFSEWRKHGTCTGLAPQAYFDKTRAAFERVSIPDVFRDGKADPSVSAAEAERAFVAANPGMRQSAIAVACEAGLLQEVRICMSRDLQFRACPEVDRRGCRRTGLRMPALN